MMITGNFADILNPAMRSIYDQVFKDYVEEYSKVFSVDNSDRHYEKFSSATGFGMAADVDEGTEIPYDDIAQGYDVTFEHKKIAKGFIVSRELMEDENLSSVNLVNSVDLFYE